MDRFIVKQFIAISNNISILKSNMDRFIEEILHKNNWLKKFLKSNMDRFIAVG